MSVSQVWAGFWKAADRRAPSQAQLLSPGEADSWEENRGPRAGEVFSQWLSKAISGTKLCQRQNFQLSKARPASQIRRHFRRRESLLWSGKWNYTSIITNIARAYYYVCFIILIFVAVGCHFDGEIKAHGDGVGEGAGNGVSARAERAGWGQWKPSVKAGTVAAVQLSI